MKSIRRTRPKKVLFRETDSLFWSKRAKSAASPSSGRGGTVVMNSNTMIPLTGITIARHRKLATAFLFIASFPFSLGSKQVFQFLLYCGKILSMFQNYIECFPNNFRTQRVFSSQV